jgi:hypothetical protein
MVRAKRGLPQAQQGGFAKPFGLTAISQNQKTPTKAGVYSF